MEFKSTTFAPKTPGHMPGVMKPSPADTAVSGNRSGWTGFAQYTDHDLMNPTYQRAGKAAQKRIRDI